MRCAATTRNSSAAAVPTSASAIFFRYRSRRRARLFPALPMCAKVPGMVKFASFVAAWLLAMPAFAQVDCNAGMEPIDASATFSLSARDFIRVVVANERDFVKGLGSHGYALDITIETLKGDSVD